MGAEHVLMLLRLLDMLASVAIRSADIQAEFQVLSGDLRRMVEEGREPTPEEWAEQNARVDDLHQRLQAD